MGLQQKRIRSIGLEVRSAQFKSDWEELLRNFGGSREVAGPWNCVVQLPGRTVTAHFTVRGSKVTTLRVEIVQCAV